MPFKTQSKAGRKLFLSAYLCVLKKYKKSKKIRNKALQILIFMINYSIYMQPQVYCSDKGEIHMNKKVYCKRAVCCWQGVRHRSRTIMQPIRAILITVPYRYKIPQALPKKILKSGSFICLIRQREAAIPIHMI